MNKPIVVCLCGSTRFGKAFADANLSETLAGRIVLTIGCNMKSDTELFGHMRPDELQAIKTRLDELHKRKIDLADEILVLNVDGYVGDSTRSEIEYARQQGKSIRWLEPYKSWMCPRCYHVNPTETGDGYVNECLNCHMPILGSAV